MRFNPIRCSWVALCASLVLAAGTQAAVTQEVEPNNTKAQATAVTMASGDVIFGTTTGNGAAAGATSADFFKIKTTQRPLGIYRHSLTLNTLVGGHDVSLRGLKQATGQITANSDVALQQAVNGSVCVWYGFGREEQVYYRVTGTAATIAEYRATLSTSEVIEPIPVFTKLKAGQITIKPDAATDAGTDLDFWVYDSNFNPIADAGHDANDVDGLTLNLAAGTYNIAFTNYNFANNLASPANDAWRSGNVADFANAAMTSSLSGSYRPMGFKFTDSAGQSAGINSDYDPALDRQWFGIVWVRIIVVNANDLPGFYAVGTATPAIVSNDGNGTVRLRVVVTDPNNNGGYDVRIDCSPLGGERNVSANGVVGQPNAFETTVTIPQDDPRARDGPKSVWFLVIDLVGGTNGINTASGTMSLTITDPMRITPAAAPARPQPGNNVVLTAAVRVGDGPPTTGTMASVNLSGIGGLANRTLFDDGTNGDATANDLTFSFSYTIPAGQAAGAYNIPFSAMDAQGRSATATLVLNIDKPGELPANAEPKRGQGPVNQMDGDLSPGDVDMFRVRLCDPSAFFATVAADDDTQLFIFDESGRALVMSDDSSGGSSNPMVTSQHLMGHPPQDVFIAISQFDNDPLDQFGMELWADLPAAGQHPPDGPGFVHPITQWSGVPSPADSITYTITLSGACFLPAPCHGLCVADFDDGSGAGNPDGGVGIDDLLYYLGVFEMGRECADVDDGTFTGTTDGGVSIEDLLYYLYRFDSGC